ncbi:MAG: hypothetical protein AABM67_14465 [Acidobacteriota bacterium]
MVLPQHLERPYRELAANPKYQHFTRIPDRIIQCIDHFRIPCDREAVSDRLHEYYLFIGVVDDAIDSSRLETGRLVLDYLNRATVLSGDEVGRSKLELISEVLKHHISDTVHSPMMNQFRELYHEVISERCANEIGSFIEHRQKVGSLTAELSFTLIQPHLGHGYERLPEFMKQVGALGCLIDSLIDLNKDRRQGLLGFDPKARDLVTLANRILRDGMQLSLRNPRLCGLFLQAIVDNLRDRFRAERDVAPPAFVSERKGTAAGVA